MHCPNYNILHHLQCHVIIPLNSVMFFLYQFQVSLLKKNWGRGKSVCPLSNYKKYSAATQSCKMSSLSVLAPSIWKGHSSSTVSSLLRCMVGGQLWSRVRETSLHLPAFSSTFWVAHGQQRGVLVSHGFCFFHWCTLHVESFHITLSLHVLEWAEPLGWPLGAYGLVDQHSGETSSAFCDLSALICPSCLSETPLVIFFCLH